MEDCTMKNRPFANRLAVATALAATSAASVLGAQVTELARRPIADVAHLTFGSLCDDKFVIRNDGPSPVQIEYAVSKGNEHSPLTLAGREQVELESRSKEPLELWMDGKLIAKAEKEGRKCREAQGNASVVVAPLEVPPDRNANANTQRNNARFGLGFGYGYPFYDPWFSPFGAYGWGFRPYYAGFYGVPIVIGRGARRR
jgi:hypothetical protein